MGLLNTLFGGVASAAGQAAGAAINPAGEIINGAKGILSLVKLDPNLKAQLEAQLTAENIDLEKAKLAAQVSQLQGQLDIDKQEAASANWWIAGWRPYIGWICGTALAWEFVVKPFLVFGLAVFHHAPLPPLPALDTAALISGILAPLLGLGTMRSVEKIQGAPGADQLQ